jgi:hypothetical protein
MSKALEKAREQYRAGQHKKAADTLWEVSFGGDDNEAEARGVLELASLLRDASTGAVRTECEEHIARAAGPERRARCTAWRGDKHLAAPRRDLQRLSARPGWTTTGAVL